MLQNISADFCQCFISHEITTKSDAKWVNKEIKFHVPTDTLQVISRTESDAEKRRDFTLLLFWPVDINYKKFQLLLTRCAKFLFANYQSISSHFVAIHSWSVCCSRRPQKLIKTPYFGNSGSFEVIDVDIRLKSSSLVLVVIGSMPMVICNRFHERLANDVKITTFTGVPLFDALVRRFSWTYKIETWTIEIYVHSFIHSFLYYNKSQNAYVATNM